MKTYYGRYKLHKTYHRIHANSVSEAREKMQKGTTYKLSEIFIKTKEPRTKFII